MALMTESSSASTCIKEKEKPDEKDCVCVSVTLHVREVYGKPDSSSSHARIKFGSLIE